MINLLCKTAAVSTSDLQSEVLFSNPLAKILENNELGDPTTSEEWEQLSVWLSVQSDEEKDNLLVNVSLRNELTCGIQNSTSEPELIAVLKALYQLFVGGERGALRSLLPLKPLLNSFHIPSFLKSSAIPDEPVFRTFLNTTAKESNHFSGAFLKALSLAMTGFSLDHDEQARAKRKANEPHGANSDFSKFRKGPGGGSGGGSAGPSLQQGPRYGY